MFKDAELLKKLKDSSLKDIAFSELLDAYQERLYWHIRKIVITHENADDVLQNTFVRVYKSIHNFQEKSSLHTWMYRIAYNESLRFLEKNRKKNMFLLMKFLILLPKFYLRMNILMVIKFKKNLLKS